MKTHWINTVLAAHGLILVSCTLGDSLAADTAAEEARRDGPRPWQQKAAAYARIMSQVQWTPVADGIPAHPRRMDGYFEAGKTYTGVPYSNGGHDGRYIGFDIYLKTFLAAVENPHSVLYTKDMRGQRRNSAAYYGMVCSAYTTYALQSAVQFASRGHVPPHRGGIRPADPQSAQGAEVGDVVFWPGHVEIVTQVTRDADGMVTHVRVEDSWPPTTRTLDRTALDFGAYLSSRKATLYRVTDRDAWLGDGKAESFLFPNYAEDATTPKINRVLLLDRGDWVAYRKDQTVAFNVMDRDNAGVRSLVIKREGEPVETIELGGTGIVERAFSICGDYTAHCVMIDGTSSQACEFSVCELDSRPAAETVAVNQPWEIEFSAANMNVILVWIGGGGVRSDSYTSPRRIWLADQDRRRGRVVVPGDVLPKTGAATFYVAAENRYGRLRNRHTVTVANEDPRLP